jgi:hypothetical protein
MNAHAKSELPGCTLTHQGIAEICHSADQFHNGFNFDTHQFLFNK